MSAEKVETTKPDWAQLAKARWGKGYVYNYQGGGPFAVLQHCETLTIPLCPTVESALQVLGQRCTSNCDARHSLVQLQYEEATGKVRVRVLHRNRGFRDFIQRHGEAAV